MCNFLSAIYMKTGRLLCQPEYTDSHSDLMAAHGIQERATDAPVQHFVRLELTPPDDWSLDLDQWREQVDEHETPEWFGTAERFDAFEQMRDVVKKSIVDGKRDILLGGFWILAPGADVRVTRNCRIRVMLGSSQVGEMWGSSQVGNMWGSSQVGKMLDSSQVGKMLDSSQVGEMWGSSQVGNMWGSSQVGKMWGSSQVGKMLDSSQVGNMLGSSQVGEMWGSSQVGNMWGSSQVGKMWGSSQVGEDLREKTVETH